MICDSCILGVSSDGTFNKIWQTFFISPPDAPVNPMVNRFFSSAVFRALMIFLLFPLVDNPINTSYLTAVANDYSFDVVYSRLVDGIGNPGDVLVGLSTSGNSKNIINALETASTKNMSTISFTGATGGKMKDISDILINVPSTDTPRIQESHIMIGHIICQLVEEKYFHQ